MVDKKDHNSRISPLHIPPPPHATSIFMAAKKLSTPVRESIPKLLHEDASLVIRPRFILLGGFLGAGKTTCLKRLVEWLEARQLKVGVVTNDQADRLVDTAVALDGAAADSVRQISGGCFCCKADDLVTKLHELQVAVRPDVLIAEPVGSCTDLMATVILPLQQVYRENFTMAPMSVVVDAARMFAAWFPAKGKKVAKFSSDVDYIFLKQLEEAEIVVLNKMDLLTVAQRVKLRERLLGVLEEGTTKNTESTKDREGGKVVYAVSTTTGEGLDEWFSYLMRATSAPARLMEVDYERYAAGEALMGWYNAALSLHSTGKPVDGNKLLTQLAGEIMTDLEGEGVELAHFKMSLKTSAMPTARKTLGKEAGNNGAGSLGVVNAVRNGQKPTLSRRLGGPVVAGEFLVNLRAEGAPEILEAVVGRHLDKTRAAVRFVWREKCAFRLGRPVPVHRVTSLEGVRSA